MKHKFFIPILITLFLIMILISSNLFSDVNAKSTIIVDIEGTGDYVSIQEGINAASDGDTVLVYPGIYYENVIYNGKNLTLASKYLMTGDESYIDSTIIDGNESGSCVLVFQSITEGKICGFTLQHGSGSGGDVHGGGIYLSYNYISSFYVDHCVIKNNRATTGGGISSVACQDLYLVDTKIFENFASSSGGGISKGDDWINIHYSSTNKCDIYNNYAPKGSDIYNHKGDMDVIVDTFTVEEPNEFYAYSREDEITIDIENYKIDPINNDLYVSPEGNNSNNGLTPSDPLLNIYDALIKIKSNSTHPNTIYLAEGTYSPSQTGEFFAVGGKDYLSIVGAGKDKTILDAEHTFTVIGLNRINSYKIENITIKHGVGVTGGITVRYSNGVINNVNLIDNDIRDDYITSHLQIMQYCEAICNNVNIYTSYYEVGAVAVMFDWHSNILFSNCSIKDIKTNEQIGNFGAMTVGTYAAPVIINTLIADNFGQISSGIASLWSGDPIYVINSTIVDNDDCSEGTIRLVDNSHIHLINTILRNEPDTEIYFHLTGPANSASLEYCNVDGGIDAIDVNNNGTLNYAETNIDQDPLFVGGDPFSYQLSEGSPCIDAGTPDTTGLNLPASDLAGNPRIYNGRVDIGAYEYIPNAAGEEPDTSFVNKLYLFQNQPNPFKNSTKILFITSDYERVENYTLSIYNTKGQLVRRYKGRANNFSFKTKVIWDGKDSHGREVAPGTYFYKLEYNNNAVVRKMVKVK